VYVYSGKRPPMRTNFWSGRFIAKLSHVGESLQLAKIQVAEHINTTSPIASLPDEILAMIFEAGARQQAQRSENRVYFSMLVSQVTHRFRAIAIATGQPSI
jgi:hypothetical protein